MRADPSLLSLSNASDSRDKYSPAISYLDIPMAPKLHMLRTGNLHDMVAKVTWCFTVSQSSKTDEVVAVWEPETTTSREII